MEQVNFLARGNGNYDFSVTGIPFCWAYELLEHITRLAIADAYRKRDEQFRKAAWYGMSCG